MLAAILLLLFSGLATPLFAQFSPDLLSGRFKARGIVTTFYSEEDQRRLLTISVKKIYTDHERRGFFKLGILPVAVLENTAVEIPDPRRIRQALSQFENWLGPTACKRIEIRSFTLVIKGDHALRMESGRAKLGADGALKLLNGVRLSTGTTNSVTSASGSLQIAGGRSGDLLLSTPPVKIELFSDNQQNP